MDTLKRIYKFQDQVNKELQFLINDIPTIWAIEETDEYNGTHIHSYHLTKEEAETQKPKDYYVFYGSGEESGTYKVIEINTNCVPINVLMTIKNHEYEFHT